MLPFMKNTKIRTALTVVLILVACTGVYYFVKPSAISDMPPALPRETEVAKQDAKIKITPTTDIVQRIIYLKCNEEETFRTKPADNLVGLNYQQVQQIYSGWTIEKFDTPEVTMSLKVNSLCREHANNMFIGVKDGYVAVFHGKPGSKAILKEVTKIPITKLVPGDAEELKHGMVVQSREELLRFIEGLESR
ncbi:BofC-like protein [Anaerospora hongkongensis]|uniref:BofC-like protein n=1 Tax=Anaerospora hongkongensis TaxID=244830 RepID=A0A4R1Q4N4_9FIRM|nr:BofC C-terminal domain-containing protein [Anaerospora hongkongensis]TCL35808.1 BofC-like protein [Anaerospora hongkongensis]